MTAVGEVLIVIGGAMLVVSAVGLFVLHDALARQHAATKAGTLALAMILLGTAMASGGGAGWWWRVAAVEAWLVLTLPVASHLIARAAYRAGTRRRATVRTPETS